MITYQYSKDLVMKFKRKVLRKFPNTNIILVENNSLLSLCSGDKGISYSIINNDLIDNKW